MKQEPPQPPNPQAVSTIIEKEIHIAETSIALKKPASGSGYEHEIDYVLLQSLISSLDQNRGERVSYAKKTFWLTVGWIFVVLAIVTLSGVEYNYTRLLSLSDPVIITLITTTTVNVFGFFLLVMQFLFNKRELEAITYLTKKKAEKASTGDSLK